MRACTDGLADDTHGVINRRRQSIDCQTLSGNQGSNVIDISDDGIQ